MGRHGLYRIGRSQQGRTLRRAGGIDEGHRHPDKLDLFVQRQRLLPQVAAVRALRVKHHVHGVGAHQRTHGKATSLLGQQGIGVFGLDAAGGRLGRLILGRAGRQVEYRDGGQWQSGRTQQAAP